MTLRDAEQKAVESAIQGFHWYLNNGLPVEVAKKLSLQETVMVKAIQYIKNYQSEA